VIARLLTYTRPVAGRLGLAVLAGTGAAGTAIGLMATSAWLISRAAQHPPVLDLMVAIVAVRAFGLGRAVLRYAERLVGHDAALRVLGDLRSRSYARLSRLAPAGLAGAGRLGDLLSQFVTDLDDGVDVLVRAVIPYAVAVLVAVGSVALVGAILPPTAAVLAAGLFLVVLGVPLLHRMVARRAQRRLAPLRAELASGTVALLHGLPDLVAYGAAPAALSRINDTDRLLRQAATRQAGSLGLGAGLVSLVAGTCVWAGLVLGAAAVEAHRLDPVRLAVVVLTPLAVFEALGGLPAAATALGTGRAALRRVFTLLDRPDPVPDPLVTTATPVAPYRIRVENVTARWTPGGPDVLRDLTLDLPPGSRTAIVGPSGVGKSTLAALLVRFLDPVAGRVTLNGIDLSSLTGDQVRSVVGLVGDDAWLFDTTIEENLRIGRRDATGEQLRDALSRARLLDWVDSLPRGLDTPVGEHGAALSGGQRRRLALARALLADFPVLVLDEPTEHLDEPTARDITADLLDAAGTRTVVLITHRRYGLDRVDTVVDLTAQSLVRQDLRH
jgi:thiol reductant ABC exporter CydC subunit